MAFSAINPKSRLLPCVLGRCGYKTSIRSISTTNRSLRASDRSTIAPENTRDVPPKFSESAAFAQRRDRPSPTALPLTFWEEIYVKTGAYQEMNRMSCVASFIVFMVYFCILREENDLDEELSKPLWQRLPSLEEQVLHERIILGKNKGDDVSMYEERYEELQKEKLRELERLNTKK